jgi:nitrate/nitrite transporter NarK
VYAGLVTYGLIGFHLARAHIVTSAAVPLLYAAAMAAGAVAALITGVVYDRCGPWILVVLPAMVAAVPALAGRRGRGWALCLGLGAEHCYRVNSRHSPPSDGRTMFEALPDCWRSG